jgi:hypothetical protein
MRLPDLRKSLFETSQGTASDPIDEVCSFVLYNVHFGRVVEWDMECRPPRPFGWAHLLNLGKGIKRHARYLRAGLSAERRGGPLLRTSLLERPPAAGIVFPEP